MDIFIQQIVNGLVLGSIYALIALGYTMANSSPPKRPTRSLLRSTPVASDAKRCSAMSPTAWPHVSLMRLK